MAWYWNFLILGFIPVLWIAWAAVGALIILVQRAWHKLLYRW